MRIALFAVLAVFLSGCGDIPRSTVRGKVTYKGKPLQMAAVVFIASDNKTHPLYLKPDGSYEVTGVARGTIKVAIQSEPEGAAISRSEKSPKKDSPEAAKDAARAAALKESPTPPLTAGPPLDPKLANAETSGLTFDLTNPEQEWSIDLK